MITFSCAPEMFWQIPLTMWQFDTFCPNLTMTICYKLQYWLANFHWVQYNNWSNLHRNWAQYGVDTNRLEEKWQKLKQNFEEDNYRARATFLCFMAQNWSWKIQFQGTFDKIFFTAPMGTKQDIKIIQIPSIQTVL